MRAARRPWKLVYPETILLNGITHMSHRWDRNQILTDCGIHYRAGTGAKVGKPQLVDCMACLVAEIQP